MKINIPQVKIILAVGKQDVCLGIFCPEFFLFLGSTPEDFFIIPLFNLDVLLEASSEATFFV
ncbi:MAG: hypothetical protein ACPLRX_05360 [Candidatus Saccharicenans sp.]